MWFMQNEVWGKVQFWENLHKHGEIEAENKQKKMLIFNTANNATSDFDIICGNVGNVAKVTF